MSFQDKLGPPFPDSERSLRAFNSAAYFSITLGMELDPRTGELTVLPHGETGEAPLKGTLGEILTDDRVYVPNLGGEAEQIDLAFMMGYLLGKLNERQATNG